MKKIYYSFLTVGSGLLALPAKVLAQAGDVELKIADEKVPAIDMQSFLSGAIRLVLVVAALAFFFTLVIGGIQWILSGGDKTGAESARKRITGALVGLAIVFLAWAIASLIKSLFGFDVLNPTLIKFTK